MKAPSKKIQRDAKRMYDSFPDLASCWERSPEHKKYFVKYLGCYDLKNYHHHHHGCKPFDDFISRWADKHTRDFFTYYKVNGCSTRDISYTNELVNDKRKIKSLSNMSIRRKTRIELQGRDIPREYNDWPFLFTIPDLIFDDNDKRDMIVSIEKCIERRLIFRNGCIRACSLRIETESHDLFLKILQIMRAQLISNNDDLQ